jgi:hypothetical protein
MFLHDHSNRFRLDYHIIHIRVNISIQQKKEKKYTHHIILISNIYLRNYMYKFELDKFKRKHI